MKWFRLYSEILDDPKIKRLKDPRKKWIFVGLLCMASESKIRGKILIDEDTPYTPEEIAKRLDVDVRLLRNTCEELQRLKIIEIENGVVIISNWHKRQRNSDNVSERVRCFREKKCNVTETLQKRYRNVSVTPPDNRLQITDTDLNLNKDLKDLKDFVSSLVITKEETRNSIFNNQEKEITNNSELIAELTEEYRRVVPPDKHQRGDYAFIGRLYNEKGYDSVFLAVNELGYCIESGFVPDKPLIYLRGIVNKIVNKSENNREKSRDSPFFTPSRPVEFESWVDELYKKRREKRQRQTEAKNAARDNGTQPNSF